MNRGYRKDKYSNKEVRYSSNGIVPLTPNISDMYEEELNSGIEFPMVLLSILAIIVVLINIIPGVL